MRLKAKHFQGGDYFGNMQIDIRESYPIQDEWLKFIAKKRYTRKNILINLTRFYIAKTLEKLNLIEPLIMTGILKNWFLEFKSYWNGVLQGRPLTIMDFPLLKFVTRARPDLP